MDLYKLWVINWSIFTLSFQLILCASVNSKFEQTLMYDKSILPIETVSLTPTTTTTTTTHINTGTISAIASVAAHQPHRTEQLCTNIDDSINNKHIREINIETSLILDLYPGGSQSHHLHSTSSSSLSSTSSSSTSSSSSSSPCKTILTTTQSNGFIVRLDRIKSRINKYNGGSSSSSNMDHSSKSSKNSTKSSCPLSVVPVNDPQSTPWKLDPCQLDEQLARNPQLANSAIVDQQEDDQFLRLFLGRLKIIWNHNGNRPNYRLIVTALGKGNNCDHKGQHACLKFGQEIFFCISDTLVCDGIQHCPVGNGYRSDEDEEMCKKKNVFGTNWWHYISKDIHNIMPASGGSSGNGVSGSGGSNVKTQSTTVPLVPNDDTINNIDDNNNNNSGTNSTDDTSTTKNKGKRNSLSHGLSKYGPWGYLMLGMLLCGGALLICGLWECCCRSKKPTTDITGDDPVISTISGELSSTGSGRPTTIRVPEPPNYEESDPPPSYSTLFPNQKSSDALNLDQQQTHIIGGNNDGIDSNSTTTTTTTATTGGSDSDTASSITTITTTLAIHQQQQLQQQQQQQQQYQHHQPLVVDSFSTIFPSLPTTSNISPTTTTTTTTN